MYNKTRIICEGDNINIPAIAYKTYSAFKDHPLFSLAYKRSLKLLRKNKSARKRVRLIHDEVDASIDRVFKDPLVKVHVSCQSQCAACCHTQVSATKDEAIVLGDLIQRKKVRVDLDRLEKQVVAQNNGQEWYKLNYQDRKCIFLDENNLCKVYDDRPSVCRTNYVVSDPSLCDPSDGKTKALQLLKTFEADMIIAAHFHYSKESGILPQMIYEVLSQNLARTKEKILR